MQYQLTINADHFQFYLEDDTIEHNTALLWRQQAHADRLDVLPGLIAVETGRYGGDVPVVIEVRSSPPTDTAFELWDHVVECAIEVRGSRLLLTSPDSFGPGSPEVALPPGTYRARVYYAHLDSVDDEMEMEGDDHYKIVLWPGAPVAPRVLKWKPRP
jgi:hypothetical protein